MVTNHHSLNGFERSQKDPPVTKEPNTLKNTPRIISFGEVLWDLFPDGQRFGGAPANFACHAAALGADVSMVTTVGNDQLGRNAIEILNGYGIDTTFAPTHDSAPTGTVGVELDGNGNPTYNIHKGSAWDLLKWTVGLGQHIKQVDAVYFGTLAQRCEDSRATIRKALTFAKDAGILRVLDLNLRPPFFDEQMIRDSLEYANILKLNTEELSQVAKACEISSQENHIITLQKLVHNHGFDKAVLTRGPKGALLVTQTEVIHQEGIPTIVKDTVGAGDSLAAAFVLGVLNERPLQETLESACQVAARVCSHSGGVPDITDPPILPSLQA